MVLFWLFLILENVLVISRCKHTTHYLNDNFMCDYKKEQSDLAIRYKKESRLLSALSACFESLGRAFSRMGSICHS